MLTQSDKVEKFDSMLEKYCEYRNGFSKAKVIIERLANFCEDEWRKYNNDSAWEALCDTELIDMPEGDRRKIDDVLKKDSFE